MMMLVLWWITDSRVNTVPCAILLDTNGNKVMDIQESDFSQLFAAGYKFPEVFKVKAADGVTDLYGVMYKPFNFDSTKVYPIVDYVYPGPQVEGVYYPFTRMSPRTVPFGTGRIYCYFCGTTRRAS